MDFLVDLALADVLVARNSSKLDSLLGAEASTQKNVSSGTVGVVVTLGQIMPVKARWTTSVEGEVVVARILLGSGNGMRAKVVGATWPTLMLELVATAGQKPCEIIRG